MTPTGYIKNTSVLCKNKQWLRDFQKQGSLPQGKRTKIKNDVTERFRRDTRKFSSLINHVSIYKYVAICKHTILRRIRTLVHRTHKH
jgi:hypothetical protein